MTDTPSLSILFANKDNPALTLSGYAKIAQEIVPRLMDAGYEVKLHCTVGHQHGTLQWVEPKSGRTLDVWSGGSGPYGEDIVPLHMSRMQELTGKPALVLFVGDAVALGALPDMVRKRQLLGAAWSAVDWESPMPAAAMDRLSGWLRLWSMSQHGDRVLREAGAKNLLPPVWLGCDTQVFRPAQGDPDPQIMERMGFARDTFNVFSCFANQYERKGEYEMLSAIGEFHKRHPEAKIRFFGVTQVRRDWDLAALSQHLGLQKIVRFSDDYEFTMGDVSEEDVASMFRACDAVLHLGYEGFGLQALEAQATGKPVIGFDAGATPEILAHGVLVPPARDKMLQNLLRRPILDGPKVVEALEWVYERRADRARWEAGRRWVEANATWDHSARGLIANLRSVEQAVADEDLLGPPEPGPEAVERMRQRIEVELG